MDMKIKPFDFAQAVARAGLTTQGQPVAGGREVAGASFQSAMTQALQKVSASQNEAQKLQHAYQLGNPAVGEEQVMVSMVKAQIGFQSVLSVRNRMVQAYSEIMNMQV